MQRYGTLARVATPNWRQRKLIPPGRSDMYLPSAAADLVLLVPSLQSTVDEDRSMLHCISPIFDETILIIICAANRIRITAWVIRAGDWKPSTLRNPQHWQVRLPS